MLPGMGGMKKQLEAAKDQINDRAVARQLAIISSMTPLERSKPELLKAKPKATNLPKDQGHLCRM